MAALTRSCFRHATSMSRSMHTRASGETFRVSKATSGQRLFQSQAASSTGGANRRHGSGKMYGQFTSASSSYYFLLAVPLSTAVSFSLFAQPTLADLTEKDLAFTQQNQSGEGMLLKYVSKCEPHPAKAYKGGEDAHFIQLCQGGGYALGVADGVGGWSKRGIDPAHFARALMANAKNAAKSSNVPLQILEKAYERTEVIMGSSTAVIAVVLQGKLRFANLGDSGLMVVRDNNIALRTKEQQHYFNCPLQLTGAGKTSKRDLPSHSDRGEMDLNGGELILIASDGFWDNMFDDDTIAIIRQDLKKVSDPSALTLPELDALANSLVSTCRQIAVDPLASTPFSENARKVKKAYFGGKLDDITIILAQYTAKKQLRGKL